MPQREEQHLAGQVRTSKHLREVNEAGKEPEEVDEAPRGGHLKAGAGMAIPAAVKDTFKRYPI